MADKQQRDQASPETPSLEAEIERVGRRDPVSWRSTTLMVAIAGFSIYLAWSFRGEVRYFFSESTPIALSDDGVFMPERARPNRFVSIDGLPSAAKVQYKQLGATYKVFFVLGSRVFVRAKLLPGQGSKVEGWSTYHGKGRLLDLREESEFANIRQWYEERRGFDFSRPAWILLDQVEPGHQWQYPLAVLVLGLVALLNVVFFVRRLLRRRAAG